MKKLMVALLVLVAFSNIALAQDDLYIGVFGDDAYSYCYGDVVPFEPMTIYVAAFLSDVVPAITAAEFRDLTAKLRIHTDAHDSSSFSAYSK